MAEVTENQMEALMMPYYVYIIQCKDGSFYTGYTRDLGSRLMLHANGKGAKYTRMHKAERLVYAEKFNSRAEAMRREKKVKGLSHRQKLELADCKIKLK